MSDKLDAGINNIVSEFQGESPKFHGLNRWWVLIIVTVIIIAIIIICWILSQRLKSKEDHHTSDCYFLVWGDDFSEGTPTVLPTFRHHNDRLDSDWENDHTSYRPKPPNAFCREGMKCLPNVENWTTLNLEGKDDLNGGDQIYTDHPTNATVKNKTLFLRAIPETTMISDQKGSRTYRFTSAKLVSRAAFTNGFFAIKAKVKKGQGLQARIGLLPYFNVCMNQVGSKYGRWPACGEIEYLKTVNLDQSLFGSLFFGGKNEVVKEPPGDKPIAKIDWNKSHIFGLEWTRDFIAWHIGSDVSKEGKICGGRILQRIPREKWFSLTPKGKKRLPPAPFDQPFHLMLSLSVHLEDGPIDNGEEVGGMEVDWVKVYQRPSKLSVVKEDDSDSDSDDDDDHQDIDHDVELHHSGTDRKRGPMGF